MADRTIIFSAPMVRALLDGRKTQTRRALKSQPIQWEDESGPRVPVGLLHVEGDPLPRVTIGRVVTMQEVRFAVGDRLWVKETWCHTGTGVWSVRDTYTALGGHVIYRADDDGSDPGIKWFSPLFLPRNRSRLTLLVADVRVQRLQEISEEDAIAEGLRPDVCAGQRMWDPGPPHGHFGDPRVAYRMIWEDIHGAGSWVVDPWIAAISFEVVKANIDALTHPSQGVEDQGLSGETGRMPASPSPRARLTVEPHARLAGSAASPDLRGGRS